MRLFLPERLPERTLRRARLMVPCLIAGLGLSGGSSPLAAPAAGKTASTAAHATAAHATAAQQDASPVLKQYCVMCHSKAAAQGGIGLDKLLAQDTFGDDFTKWQRVASALEQKRMPPAKLPQPSEAQRTQAIEWIRARLDAAAQKNAGDPGRVTVRRLTSGEYSWSIQDLTGLDLKLERDFVADSVGGEGFTNFGDVQYMGDASMEQYLATAKLIASHAVIGSGPLQFFRDPGKSGFELSALDRIQNIYTKYGFRAVAGEGGRPYGLDLYGKAYFAAWKYRHRQALGQPKATLASLAKEEGLNPKFLTHVWNVLNQPAPTYPTTEVIERWRALPKPKDASEATLADLRKQSQDIQFATVNWGARLFAAGELAAGGLGDERALVLTDESIEAVPSYKFRFPARIRGNEATRVYLTLLPMNPHATDKPGVIWHDAKVRIRPKDKPFGEPIPLAKVLDADTVRKLNFGRGTDGSAIDPNDFALAGDASVELNINAPADAQAVEFTVEAKLEKQQTGGAVLRCTVSDKAEVSTGRPVWTLLADPSTPAFKAWKSAVLKFAKDLPQNSQAEPAPSDKDQIPPPFNNTYNQPERDHFHQKLKYVRDDSFFIAKMIDEPVRRELEHAWNDLLSSFEYHDLFMQFVLGKFKVDVGKQSIAELDAAEIAAIPEEPRRYIKALKAEYDGIHRALKAAEPGHVEDALNFASRAWRRPLTETEKVSLRSFYREQRQANELTHDAAIRALLARILVSPAFLYRLEPPAETSTARPLTNWEMASRLSYFLWSSVPDNELRRAAAAGELTDPKGIGKQVKRMAADPKARRVATEFFGQWLGFYRFDQYRGVDPKRFPEFTDEVKAAMYDEAVSFFEHIVRKDRPIREMLDADYTFLNEKLAKHYGIDRKLEAAREAAFVDGVKANGRGGMLRLGAVLTATSAPLRTSPVKRGEWMLRRVLGTPVPPPPPDAGSLPADDKAFGGMTVRQRLEVHKRNPTCNGCHSRIDPLGFPLERYDPVGRVRNEYSDGKPIDDSTELADKTPIEGVDGLLAYLRKEEKQVMRNFSAKLLGFALGRTMLVSDMPLIDRMASLGGDASFSKLAAEVATSKQFRYRREGGDAPSPTPGTHESAKSIDRKEKEGGL